MIPQNITKTKSPRFLTIVKNLGQANFENHSKNSPTTPPPHQSTKFPEIKRTSVEILFLQ